MEKLSLTELFNFAMNLQTCMHANKVLKLCFRLFFSLSIYIYVYIQRILKIAETRKQK
jgi:hypothetical protein